MNNGRVYDLMRLSDAFPTFYDRHPALVTVESALERRRKVELELVPSPYGDSAARPLRGELRIDGVAQHQIPHAVIAPADSSIRFTLFPRRYPQELPIFVSAYPDTGLQLLTMEFAAEPAHSEPSTPVAVWRRNVERAPALEAMSDDAITAAVSDLVTEQEHITSEDELARVKRLMSYVLERPLLLRDEVREGLDRLIRQAKLEQANEWHAYFRVCREVLAECRRMAVDGRWEAVRSS